MVGAILRSAALAVVIGGTSTAANANPLSFFYSTDGTSFTQFGTTQDGTNSATFMGTAGSTRFTIAATAFAPPAVPAPTLQTSFVGITAFGAASISVAVVETGVMAPGISGFGISFGNGPASTGDVASAAATVVNGSSTVLASASLAPGESALRLASAAGLPTTFALAELFTATFGTAGGSVDANVSIFGVPEPMSLALLGMGLAGVATMRTRRTIA